MTPVVGGTALRSTRHRYARQNPPKTPVLARPAVVAGVFALFVVSVFFNLRGPAGPEPAPHVEAATAQVSVMLAAEIVQEYRAEHGVLPPSLAEAGLPEAKYEYERGRDGRFSLGTTSGTRSARYDSADDPASLLASMGLPAGASR